MQPRSKELQALNSILNKPQQSQISIEDLQNMPNPSSQIQAPFDPTSSHDDFLAQMLSTLPPCSWLPDLSAVAPNPNKSSLPWDLSIPMASHKSRDSPDEDYGHFDDQPAFLASKLRQQQITGGGASSPASSQMMLQQLLLLSGGLGGGLRSPTVDSGDSGLLPMPLSLGSGDSFERSPNDVVGTSSFKSPNPGGDAPIQALYNGFNGSLHGSGQTSNQAQNFLHSQAQNYGVPAAAMSQSPASGAIGGAPAQARQRVRARRGQATDPHSIAERLRRERIAERMKSLQELVPNANKTDKASMLDEIIDYVKFLQLQVKNGRALLTNSGWPKFFVQSIGAKRVLSMSRLGGAGAIAPLVADISCEGGGDCIQTSNGGVGGRSSNGTPSTNNTMTVTEQQVAKLMEEDMGSAMQYLQGKGLCLMPISLATAISTSTTRNHHHPMLMSSNGGGGPSSPSMSVLTVQSATMGNGVAETSVKDATSVSKP